MSLGDDIHLYSAGKPGEGTAGSNLSCWFDVQEPLSFQPLDRDITSDVIVVGGGIAGVMTAYFCCREGMKVALIDDGNIGSGETGHTTAHLTAVLDLGFQELEKIHGKEKSAAITASHRKAMDVIEEIAVQENIGCDYERVNAYFFVHPSDRTDLGKESAAASRAGLEVERLDQAPGMIRSSGPCLKFSNQAQIHPMKFIAGLCRAIREKGGEIFTGTHAGSISSEGVITRSGFRVTARHVVVATNAPVNNKYILSLSVYPYRSYAIAGRVKRGNILPALWWDSGDVEKNTEAPPYHYVRIQKLDAEYDLLICGGEDHRTGLADEDHIAEELRFSILENWARKRFSFGEVVYKWSGQVLETTDGLAYIGRNPMDKDNVYIATGFSGNGITYGAIAGMLITDLITGKANDWEQIYNPSRLGILKSGKTFLKEVFTTAFDYFKNKPTDSQPGMLDKLNPNEATLLKYHRHVYGVYRDVENHLHVVDAKCTHQGCTVKWNRAEKSWDCPCHGSRFTHQGEVMNGPANQNLAYHSGLVEERAGK